MKNYLAIFVGSKNSAAMVQWKALDEKNRNAREKQGMEAWSQWVAKNEKSIVSIGSPLGKTKMINSEGIKDTTNMLAAYTVVRAESHEEAAKLFLGHPQFTIFPGDAVEIMECLPIPSR